MIKVTIELDKFGLGTDVKEIATATISNDGTGTFKYGNYDFTLKLGDKELIGKAPHDRQQNVFTLLSTVLACADLPSLDDEKPEIELGDLNDLIFD